jgi:hypothetical protein
MWEEREKELDSLFSRDTEDVWKNRIISQEKDMIYNTLQKIWDLNFGQYSFIAFKDLRTELNNLLKSHDINKEL